jgi:alkylation response protein AidB-like acyl-CoA dehydrogenase
VFLDYTKKQMEFKDRIRDFTDNVIVPLEKEYDFDKPLTADNFKKIWKQILPLFWDPNGGGLIDPATILSPDQSGDGLLKGINFDAISLGFIVEEISRANPSLISTILISVAPAGSIFLSKNEEMINRYLFPLLLGEKIGCNAITEPDHGSNSADLSTRAVLDGDNWIVNGAKTWISNGNIADICILACQCDEGDGDLYSAQLVVDREISPYQTAPVTHMGLRAFPTGNLVFRDVKVPVRNKVSGKKQKKTDGYKNIFQGFEIARSCMALCSVGIAQAAIDASVSHVKKRKQFGKFLGEFQMIQDMITDMATETEAARLLAYRALSLIQSGKRAEKEASMAKYYATEAAVRVTSRAIQIHGSKGLSDRHPVERMFRDARMYTIPDGTSQMQKLIIARAITGLSAFS